MKDSSLTLCLHVMKLCRLTQKIHLTDARQTKTSKNRYPSRIMPLNSYYGQAMRQRLQFVRSLVIQLKIDLGDFISSFIFMLAAKNTTAVQKTSQMFIYIAVYLWPHNFKIVLDIQQCFRSQQLTIFALLVFNQSFVDQQSLLCKDPEGRHLF